jgi:hypothetical protein
MTAPCQESQAGSLSGEARRSGRGFLIPRVGPDPSPERRILPGIAARRGDAPRSVLLTFASGADSAAALCRALRSCTLSLILTDSVSTLFRRFAHLLPISHAFPKLCQQPAEPLLRGIMMCPLVPEL